jgi:hypothetical protein
MNADIYSLPAAIEASDKTLAVAPNGSTRVGVATSIIIMFIGRR